MTPEEYATEILHMGELGLTILNVKRRHIFGYLQLLFKPGSSYGKLEYVTGLLHTT